MNVLLATDSFPPVCGGSGWSTYELARGLRDRGHRVLVVKVAAGPGGDEEETTYDGLRVIEFRAYAPDVPGLRNYFKNERLYARLARRLRQLISVHKIGDDPRAARSLRSSVGMGRQAGADPVAGDGPRLLAGVLSIGPAALT